MHEPNREVDLLKGDYVSRANNSGEGLRDSERNWGPRRQVAWLGTGLWLQINPVL